MCQENKTKTEELSPLFLPLIINNYPLSPPQNNHKPIYVGVLLFNSAHFDAKTTLG